MELKELSSIREAQDFLTPPRMDEGERNWPAFP